MSMLRYAITSRVLYLGDDSQKQAALLEQAAHWIADCVELIQLREKDLPPASQSKIALKILKNIELSHSPTKLLINSRPDIAIATGAHGVHLTASPSELTAPQIRSLFASASLPFPLITISCHTLEGVRRAHQDQVDAILFSPIFEKPLADQPALPGLGLERLREACSIATPIPVFALGGVTSTNAAACIAAGAAGVAGIRLFHTR
jgi:thiamine-phosphate pyrophosphorylase